MKSLLLTLVTCTALVAAELFPSGEFTITSDAHPSDVHWCIPGDSQQAGKPIILSRSSDPSQYWTYNDKTGYLRNANTKNSTLVVTVGGGTLLQDPIKDEPVDLDQIWVYDDGDRSLRTVANLSSCATSVGGSKIVMRACDDTLRRQRWTLTGK